MASGESFAALLCFSAVLLGLISRCSSQFFGGTNILYSGQSLSPGQFLRYRSYVLVMQSDCNLVLYDGGPVWATGTAGRGINCVAILQTDGNFVIYDGSRSAIWASNTAIGFGSYVVIVQPDRNVVLYGPARAHTNTNAGGGTRLSIGALENVTTVPAGVGSKP